MKQQQRRFWEFRAAASPGVGELSIYGPIGSDDDGLGWLFDEVTPKQFKAELDDLGELRLLKVMINSPGGDTFAGQAIHSMLVRHPAEVEVHVDGLAASIASLIAMAGDRVLMPRNAMLMIHDPYTIAVGNAGEFRTLADTLDTIREAMIAAYQRKSDLSHDELVAIMDAETWLTAEDALEMGFADEIEETTPVKASLVKPGVVSFNGLEVALSKFKHPPQAWERWTAPREEDRSQLTIRDAEKALRAGGFPHSFAKSIVQRGFKVPAGTESDPTPSVPRDREGPGVAALHRLSYYRTLATYGS